MNYGIAKLPSGNVYLLKDIRLSAHLNYPGGQVITGTTTAYVHISVNEFLAHLNADFYTEPEYVTYLTENQHRLAELLFT